MQHFLIRKNNKRDGIRFPEELPKANTGITMQWQQEGHEERKERSN